MFQRKSRTVAERKRVQVITNLTTIPKKYIYNFRVIITLPSLKVKILSVRQGFGSAFFFADPDPGKNLHADPDPALDPGGIRGRGLGVKGKSDFFFSFFHVSDDS